MGKWDTETVLGIRGELAKEGADIREGFARGWSVLVARRMG